MNSQELGCHAETLAAEFFVARGCTVLARNLILPGGEIDLLMLDGDDVAVVEVKALSDDRFYDPLDKIDPAKLRKLRRMLSIVAARYPERNVRLDVATVRYRGGEPVLEHLPDVLS